MEKTQYNKVWLYKEIAKRGMFTIGDVKDMFKNFQEIMEELIYTKGDILKNSKGKDRHIEVFKMSGLFTLYLKEIAAHDGWNAVKNERLKIPVTYKIVMTPSRTLLRLLREGYFEVDDSESEEDEEE